MKTLKREHYVNYKYRSITSTAFVSRSLHFLHYPPLFPIKFIMKPLNIFGIRTTEPWHVKYEVLFSMNNWNSGRNYTFLCVCDYFHLIPLKWWFCHFQWPVSPMRTWWLRSCPWATSGSRWLQHWGPASTILTEPWNTFWWWALNFPAPCFLGFCFPCNTFQFDFGVIFNITQSLRETFATWKDEIKILTDTVCSRKHWSNT